jgi:hypothetical protein
MIALIFKLGAVFAAQGVVAWFLYRSRAFSHQAWAASDLVVFGLPLLLGFALAAGILFFSIRRERVVAALALSAVGALAASFAGTVVAFNLYGT